MLAMGLRQADRCAGTALYRLDRLASCPLAARKVGGQLRPREAAMVLGVNGSDTWLRVRVIAWKDRAIAASRGPARPLGPTRTVRQGCPGPTP